jgi:cell division protein FtsA
MSKTIAIGIDIGTQQVKIIAAQNSESKEKPLPRVIATGLSESRGLRHGYVTNTGEITRSISEAISQINKTLENPARKAYLSVGGMGLGSIVVSSSIIITRADSEITEVEIEKVSEACESDLPSSYMLNRKVIHAIPLGYKIDGKTVLGRPQGMKGMKLEISMLFVTCIEQHINDLVESVNNAGIEIEDVMAGPIASSMVTLTKAQRIAGCVLANIGAETVSIVVFENDTPISLEVFPLGGVDITHDIALGLKVSLEQAEEIKKNKNGDSNFSKKKIDDIVHARLTDIFELIENHLKKIGRNGLLPAGIILTGGSANINNIEEMARSILKIPAKVAKVQMDMIDKNSNKDSLFTVAYGLCLLGCINTNSSSNKVSLNKAFRKIKKWFFQFLP